MTTNTNTEGSTMRLIYLTANSAWTFTYGDQLLRMGDASRFFYSRGEAVAAARACGLNVDRSGLVSSEG